jgi:putative MATE family efflux protein
MEEEKKQILNENLRKLLFKFSLPAVTAMIVSALYNFADTIYVGNGVGPEAIAGLTVVLPILIFIIAIALLTGIGAASIISRSLGKGNREKALIAAGNSFVINIILNIIMITFFYFFMDKILRFLGASPEIMPYASDYLSIMLFGFIFFSLSINSNNLIRAEGKPRASMYVMLTGALLNIILDPVFIFVLGMGVRGAAIATVISQFFSIMFIFFYFRSKGSIYHFKKDTFHPDINIIREIISIGFPSFLMEIMGSILFIVFIKVVRIYGGDSYITITGIGIRIIDLIFMPIIGISHGFSPIAGFNYGAELYRRVKGILKEGLIWTAAIAIAGFIIMVAFPQILIGIFTDDPQIIKNGVMPLRLIAIFAPLWGVPIIGGAFFQAIGKARPALVINLARQILIFIPSVILLPLFFDLLGVWLSWPFTDFFSVIISGIFLIREIKVINKMINVKESQARSVVT